MERSKSFANYKIIKDKACKLYSLKLNNHNRTLMKNKCKNQIELKKTNTSISICNNKEDLTTYLKSRNYSFNSYINLSRIINNNSVKIQ